MKIRINKIKLTETILYFGKLNFQIFYEFMSEFCFCFIGDTNKTISIKHLVNL